MNPYLNKVHGIMDLVQPIYTTEAQALVVMFQYYRGMWP